MFKIELKDFVKREFLDKVRVEPNYQPIVDLNSRGVYGYEALSRFEMDGTRVNPTKMFSMAHGFGVAVELDLLCRRLAIEKFPKDLGGVLFLNINPSYILSDYFGKGHTLSLALEFGLSTNRIVLELTETEKVPDAKLLRLALQHYKDMGFRVGIDDIGTGFNSLEHLLSLEGLLDFVKIPRELVHGVSRSKVKHSLVKVLTEVSLSIGAKPIYEGLEKEEDLIVLHQDFNAQLVQGFYFSPPKPPEEIKGFKVEVKTHLVPYEDGLLGRELKSFRSNGDEKFGYFLEKVESFSERYIFLHVDGSMYPLDLWRLKSKLNHIRRNLYYYKSMTEVIGIVKEAFMDVKSLPEVSLNKVDIRNLFDLVTFSDWEVFLLRREDGALKVIERHELIDYIHRKLSKVLLDSNPLTQLPGNRSIEERIKRLGDSNSEFYLCYLDIDNFKAFNDAYGFYAGDQMIKRVAFLLKDFEKKHAGKVFVGHIGGDDFVLIMWGMTQEEIKDLLLGLLRELKESLLEFYSTEDRERGYFVARGRDEEIREFPLADVSMVLVKGSSDPLDISKRSAQLKKKAKSHRGSVLVVENLNEILTISL